VRGLAQLVLFVGLFCAVPAVAQEEADGAAAPTEAPAGGYHVPPGYGTAPAPERGVAPVRGGPRPTAVVRERIPYEAGTPVPEGASLVTRYRKGYLIPGAIGFTVSYLANLVVSAAPDMAIVALPLVGFPIHQIRDGNPENRAVIGVHTVIQALSLALLVVGLIPRPYVEYSSHADRSNGRRWSLAPRVGAREAGLTFSWF